ncbi:uncharacterized protein M421DRAFT_395752 [Didymella exigua CBS 183.55]|uniref:Uncharacterized protein n=1 Tax=Didymella exigua CBS 183.55 TaxID=1150837 RepID=A0A6A5S566_9PLEO|nr:uncharacterized protein M421DRAFT_395752 [Didymella exigua CBS 183.55]KAF1933636.1 hypothetical protein M421DRAFT_395752 [Didymella exigua CBS 183.55]
MSKKWTPELDAILKCQISFGKALCNKLAERVRATGVGFTECTPKSIENRLYSWKKKNTTSSTGSGDTPTSTPKKGAAKPKKEPATPKGKTPRAKKGAAKKAGDEADEELTMSAGRKRYAEREQGGGEKKVKVEQGDDEGVGVAEVEEED